MTLSTPKAFINIDPGAAGAATIRWTERPSLISIHKFTGGQSVVDAITELTNSCEATCIACMEEVHSSPVQGISSAFAFGENFGIWQGALCMAHVPIFLVTPQRWQKPLGIQGKGDERKRALKDCATEKFVSQFPDVRVTLTNCDAMLLSEWAMAEIKAGRLPGNLYVP